MARKKTVRDSHLSLMAARLSWEEELDHKEIANRLKIGARYVDEMIREAGKSLLAEKETLEALRRKLAAQDSVENRLRKKYPHLRRLIVTPAPRSDAEASYAALIRRWADEAVEYFEGLCAEATKARVGLHVCMSGGETILEIMSRLREQPRPHVRYHASAYIGRAFVQRLSHVDPAANATIAWARSGRFPDHCMYSTISPFALSTFKFNDIQGRRREVLSQLNELVSDKSIGNRMRQSTEEINIAFAGLGILAPAQNVPGLKNRLTAGGLLKVITGIDEKIIASEGAIGDIGYCFFDEKGNGDNARWRFYLTMGDHDPNLRGVGFYRNMVAQKKPVIVAAGAYKWPAIKAALRGKLFNVLITDESTVEHLLAGD